MKAYVVRPLLRFISLFLLVTLPFTLQVQNSFGFEREPSGEKKSSAQKPAQAAQSAQVEINYEDPNLAMTSDYVTENVVLCTDENVLASDSQEKCYQTISSVNSSEARRAPISPLISDTLYLVDAVNSRRSILTTPPALVPSTLTDDEHEKRK